MSVTPKISMNIPIEIYMSFDDDGYLLMQAYSANQCETTDLDLISVYSLVKDVVDDYADDDGIVRNVWGLEQLYAINKELKDAIDLIHEVIDDEGMEDL